MDENLFDVFEEEDGSLTISWDDTNPKLAYLNDMTDEEREDYFVEAINRKLEELESEHENDS